LDTFERRYPGIPVAQLAVPATGPLATLNSFAYETDFDGVILFSFNPENILPPREKEQEEYVSFYDSRWNTNQRLNFKIASAFESILISRRDYYGINRVIHNLLEDRKLPSPIYLSIRDNRVHDADFALTDAEVLKNNRIAEVVRRHDHLLKVIDQVWPATLQALEDTVAAIHGRGGCVVFIRMPIVERWLEQDQRIFTKSRFWDSVLSELEVYGVHYDQIAGHEQISLPDGEHMNAHDQSEFTSSLLDELDRLGIYDPNGSCRP
jgi:hypothetical protein